MLGKLLGYGLKYGMKALPTAATLGTLGWLGTEAASIPRKAEKQSIIDGPDAFGDYSVPWYAARFVEEEKTKEMNKKRAKYLANDPRIQAHLGLGIAPPAPGEEIAQYLVKNAKEFNRLTNLQAAQNAIAISDAGFNSQEKQYLRSQDYNKYIDNRNLVNAANEQAINRWKAEIGLAREKATNDLEIRRDQLALQRLQTQLNQEKDMYNLETSRLNTRDKKRDATFDAIRAIGYAFGL